MSSIDIKKRSLHSAILGLCAIFFLTPAQAQTDGRRAAFEARVIGGQKAKEGQFPHQVSLTLKQNNRHFCGGSLIEDSDAESWVLTAAHCVVWLDNPSDIVVVSGTTQLSADRIVQNVVSIISHEEYDPDTYVNDIALLKLEPLTPEQRNSERAKSRHRKVIELPPLAEVEDLVKPYTAVTVSGWGVTAEGGATTNDLLYVDFLPIVDNDTCDGSYQNIGSAIEGMMLCAGFRSGGYDACQGDSGGPLLANSAVTGAPRLVGVVSWGYGCARHLYYGVYTRVPVFLRWIEENMEM